jgi:predicted PurR-regulated permease PerM
VRPTIGSTLLVIAAIGVAAVAGNVFVAARRTFAWTFATLVMAWLVSAVIELLARGMPRALALVLTVLAIGVVGVGTWVGVVASVRAEVNHVRTSLPAAAEKLEQRYDAAAKFRLAQRVHSFVGELDKRFSTRATVSKAAGTAPAYFVTGVLLLFFLGYGPRYLSGALAQIGDSERRDEVAAVLSRASSRARAYVLITLAQVAVVVAVSTLAFYLLDLPAPFVMALLLGSIGAIPYFGFVLGGLPAFLVAAADPDSIVIATVLLLIVGLQFLEIAVVRARVDPRTVRVGPALMLIVAIVGFQIYNFGGAAYAAVALVFALAVIQALPDRAGAAAPS